mgnify:FL=1
MSPNIPSSDHTTEDLYTSENITSRSKIEMVSARETSAICYNAVTNKLTVLETARMSSHITPITLGPNHAVHGHSHQLGLSFMKQWSKLKKRPV